jgi:hypothetical protein
MVVSVSFVPQSTLLVLTLLSTVNSVFPVNQKKPNISYSTIALAQIMSFHPRTETKGKVGQISLNLHQVDVSRYSSGQDIFKSFPPAPNRQISGTVYEQNGKLRSEHIMTSSTKTEPRYEYDQIKTKSVRLSYH